MVLLTSSTVSAIISMGVIVIFTLLLFISGYVLQQQSVQSIQNAIRDSPDPFLNARHGPSEPSRWNAGGLQFQEQSLQGPKDNAHTREKAAEGYYAYLQLLSTPDPSNICSAILFFKSLATNGTAIQDRLFMYPQEWDQISSQNSPEPIVTALSLLRMASTKYNIWLLPIDMTAATGYSITDTKLLRLGQIQFMQYDSVLYVQTPGLLLDTGKLDDMLLSQPLPLRYDKDRRDSYHNEAWIPMPLRAERDATLPPVYLVTVNSVRAGQVEARGHVPNVALPGFGHLAAGPSGAQSPKDSDYDPDKQPGYVFFEHDDSGHVRWAGNPLYGSWRAQQYEVCDGLDLDVMHDEDDL